MRLLWDGHYDAAAAPSESCVASMQSQDRDQSQWLTVSGGLSVLFSYVGNTMATFVMQALGCDVGAINTVHFSELLFFPVPLFSWHGLHLRRDIELCDDNNPFVLPSIANPESARSPLLSLHNPSAIPFDMSIGLTITLCSYSKGNHTGYRQFKGRRTPAAEIRELYDGLRQSYLTDFDVLLSGYSPSAEVVDAVGTIARDLRYRAAVRPGGFFWVLDPVMGDQGRLYVSQDIVPAYKQLIKEADLILPNQFEAELLSGVTISSLSGVANAVRALHVIHGTRHVVVTSVRVGDSAPPTAEESDERGAALTVVGSTRRQDGSARLFKVEVPVLECYFSGTGDMFAALMVARLREACAQMNLLDRPSWMPDDDVEAVDLPLARATEKVLNSMHMILEKTMAARNEEMAKFGSSPGASVGGLEGQGETEGEGKRRALAESKAAEVRVVRNAKDLVYPEERYKVQPIEV
ncbi:pyridoxal kinase, variant 1 [Fonsecaea monophora]|uniref:pyridoxal kinase n=1 Tax=Fonsecaea monophora TaxID=254056 RepID=A0A177FAJ3_9EURO|nr:pyridoxal kinase, variant 1 [Fonsecaea monophora]OAG41293.1 pyridoxal kinase, variant 1 [Fonsecaea monophora]